MAAPATRPSPYPRLPNATMSNAERQLRNRNKKSYGNWARARFGDGGFDARWGKLSTEQIEAVKTADWMTIRRQVSLADASRSSQSGVVRGELSRKEKEEIKTKCRSRRRSQSVRPHKRRQVRMTDWMTDSSLKICQTHSPARWPRGRLELCRHLITPAAPLPPCAARSSTRPAHVPCKAETHAAPRANPRSSILTCDFNRLAL